ncbi:hypothetical protein [Sphaerotilus mobilis]|uniref:Uncharacterized protein n=1 Tax=Sphaerotilus mobilis TaxID=47994 RepID=A0A4Q7LTZ8_9BURK|nr:hypothetical protein [Sphaerotilus mobilis]RZS57951.1 hypothetical protein EV685_0225 [Sphaerotilus mobilis]
MNDAIKENFVNHKSLQNMSTIDLEAFAKLADAISKNGIDWFIADKSICWGIKEKAARTGNLRLGRVEQINANYKLVLNLRARKKSGIREVFAKYNHFGQTQLPDGRHALTFEQALVLNNDDEFIRSIEKLNPLRKPAGHFPVDYDKSQKSPQKD